MPAPPRFGTLTLASASRWTVSLAGVIAYAGLRYVGDPPLPGANLAAYALSCVLPALIVAALLALENLSARAMGKAIEGVIVRLIVVVDVVVAQLIVQPQGSVLAEFRQSEPVVTIATEVAFMAILWLVIIAAGTAIGTFRRQSAELDSRTRELEGELASARTTSADEQTRTVDAIARIVEASNRDLAATHADDVSAALREWSDQVIRPMSHEIAASNAAIRPAPSPRVGSQWVAAAYTITERDPLPVALLVLIAIGGTPGVLFRSYPAPVALATVVAVVLFTLVGGVGVNLALRPILPRLGLLWRMVAIYVICLPLVVCLLLIFRLPMALGVEAGQAEQAMSALWIGIVTSPLLVLLTVWASILHEAGDESLELRESRTRTLAIAVAAENMQARQRRTAWSQALHGPVQAATVAASIRLDRARLTGPLDPATIEAACRPIWEALEAAKTATVEPPDWETWVARLHALWDGLIDLRVDIDEPGQEALAAYGMCRASTFDLLTEAVSNAVRHGKASMVYARVRATSDSTITIVVEDNGFPVDPMRPQGLGSALLDELSIAWKRERIDDGNCLSVELPAIAGSSG